MSTQNELVNAYDAAVSQLFEALDQAHIALVNLQAVKQEIDVQASNLGMIDPGGHDGPGKNLAKAVEAAVFISVDKAPMIHGQIESARTLLIGPSPDVAKLQAAGLIVRDWKNERATLKAAR